MRRREIGRPRKQRTEAEQNLAYPRKTKMLPDKGIPWFTWLGSVRVVTRRHVKQNITLCNKALILSEAPVVMVTASAYKR